MGGINISTTRHHIKRALKRARQIKTWQLIIILLLLLFIEATLLRFNHLHMNDLKSAVAAADESGDDAAIATALDNLSNYTFTHTIVNITEKNGESTITFGTGPIYLEHQYNKKASEALAAAEQNVTTDANPNGNVFAKAMAVCRPLALQNGWVSESPEYINCFTSEIAKYPASEALEDTYVATLPSTALFRYDFASPIWTPSPEGFLAIICLILTVIIIGRFLIWLTLRVALVFIKN